MNTPRYHATPARKCFAPGETFESAEIALQYAREASRRYRVEYTVWLHAGSILKRLRGISPAPIRA